MIGFKKLPNWLRQAYKKAVGNECEECGRKEGTINNDENIVKLEIHRIQRGYLGGTYKPSNIKVICSECHDLYDEEW